MREAVNQGECDSNGPDVADGRKHDVDSVANPCGHSPTPGANGKQVPDYKRGDKQEQYGKREQTRFDGILGPGRKFNEVKDRQRNHDRKSKDTICLPSVQRSLLSTPRIHFVKLRAQSPMATKGRTATNVCTVTGHCSYDVSEHKYRWRMIIVLPP